MANELTRRVARIDREELSALPSGWTNQERGRYLRLLLHGRGIDTNRLYRTEYYPQRHCWLLIQEGEPAGLSSPMALPVSDKADEIFYVQSLAEFRRAGISAWANLATHSTQFARCGRRYELPAKPQELTPATLADLLGGPNEGDSSVRFNSEGGWQTGPSGN